MPSILAIGMGAISGMIAAIVMIVKTVRATISSRSLKRITDVSWNTFYSCRTPRTMRSAIRLITNVIAKRSSPTTNRACQCSEPSGDSPSSAAMVAVNVRTGLRMSKNGNSLLKGMRNE